MDARQQNSTAYPIPLLLLSSTDHVTPVSGVTPTVNLRKNGGSAAAAAGSVTASDAAGVSYLSGNATDRNTLGTLVIEVTGTGADPVSYSYQIVAYDPIGDAAKGTAGTRLDASVSNTMTASLGYTIFQAIAPMSGAADGTGNGTTQFGVDGLTPDQPILPGMWVLLTSGTGAGTFGQVDNFTATGAGAGTVTLTSSIGFTPADDDGFLVLIGAATPGQVAAAAAAALNNYDAPTNAEMVARTLAAASYATAANQTTLLTRVPSTVHTATQQTADLASVTTAIGNVPGLVWAYLSSAATTVGSLGKRIVDYLTGDAFGRLGAPAGASIAADIATRLPTSSYTAPPSAVAISTQVASDLATAHGAGSWATADVSGLLTTTAFNASSVKTAADRVVLTLNASGVWSVAALANAPAGEGGGTGSTLIISPILASAANPRLSTRKLATIPQGTAPSDLINITDSTGAAVDLSAMTLRMVVATVTDENDADDRTDDEIEAVYKYESGDGLTVQGEDDNQVLIQHDAANTATCGKFRYWLYDVADPDQPVPLLKGTFDVEPAATDV